MTNTITDEIKMKHYSLEYSNENIYDRNQSPVTKVT